MILNSDAKKQERVYLELSKEWKSQVLYKNYSVLGF